MISAISERKLAANRMNARKSTGPRTPEGKARSAMNGLRHGLRASSPVLPGEDAEEYAQIVQDLREEFLTPDLAADPEAAREVEGLVGDAARAWWRSRRAAEAEVRFLEAELSRHGSRGRASAAYLGSGMPAALVRLEAEADRALLGSLAALRGLAAGRRPLPAAPAGPAAVPGTLPTEPTEPAPPSSPLPAGPAAPTSPPAVPPAVPAVFPTEPTEPCPPTARPASDTAPRTLPGPAALPGRAALPGPGAHPAVFPTEPTEPCPPTARPAFGTVPAARLPAVGLPAGCRPREAALVLPPRSSSGLPGPPKVLPRLSRSSPSGPEPLSRQAGRGRSPGGRP